MDAERPKFSPTLNLGNHNAPRPLSVTSHRIVSWKSWERTWCFGLILPLSRRTNSVRWTQVYFGFEAWSSKQSFFLQLQSSRLRTR